MEFKLKEKKLSLGSVANEYADVHFHIEDKEEKTFTTLKANKIILALHSTFFHRLFQSSEKSETFHVCLLGVANYAIHDVVKLMYGEQLTMQEKHVKRFSAFLKSIEIEVESQERSQSVIIANKKDEDRNKKEHAVSPSKRKTLMSEPTLVKKQKLSTEERDPSQQSPSRQSPLQLSPSQQSPSRRSPSRQSPSRQSPSRQSSSLSPSTSSQLFEEEKLSRKLGLSSSSESVKITNRKGGFASLDNWTETSEADLDGIDFKTVASNIKETHDDYVCNHCNFKVKNFSKATQHFIHNHQKGDTELEIIQEIMDFKKSATSEINKLQASIANGCNKTLAASKLETIINNLEQHVDSLRNLNVKNLSPNLKTKRNVLIQGINDSIKKVKTSIENL